MLEKWIKVVGSFICPLNEALGIVGVSRRWECREAIFASLRVAMGYVIYLLAILDYVPIKERK